MKYVEIMSKLRLDLEENYKNALKNGEEVKVKTLRLIKSAIKDKDISLRSDGKKDGLSEEGVLSLLQNLIKQRNESAEMYKKAGREKLVDSELKEIEIIKCFLPQQLNEDEIKDIINKIVKKENLKSIKEMGKLMSTLKLKYSGKIDMSIAGKLAKEVLK